MGLFLKRLQKKVIDFFVETHEEGIPEDVESKEYMETDTKEVELVENVIDEITDENQNSKEGVM